MTAGIYFLLTFLSSFAISAQNAAQNGVTDTKANVVEGTQGSEAAGTAAAANCYSLGSMMCQVSSCHDNPVIMKAKACSSFGETSKTNEKDLANAPKSAEIQPEERITAFLPVIAPGGASPTKTAGRLSGADAAPAAKTAPGETTVAKKSDKLTETGSDTEKPADEKTADDKAPKEDKETPATARESGGVDDSQAQAECANAADDAYGLCGPQAGGGYGGSDGGISGLGGYLGGASGSAANANLQQAGACSRGWRYCVYACQSVNPSQAGACQSLASQQTQMGQQAMANQQAASQAFNSGQQGSALPNARAADDCALNPSSPACKALAEANKHPQGKSTFGDVPKDVRAKDFNVGDPRDGAKSPFAGSGVGIDQIKAGAKNGTVANNSGGSIPGGEGGAKLGAARAGSPGAPGYTTDIMQGYQGGGGGSSAGGSLATNGDGAFGGYGRGSRDPSGRELDLKKYLPGGRLDPGMRLGGFRPFSLEINGPHYDVWSKISNRYNEKCKLGELIDCR